MGRRCTANRRIDRIKLTIGNHQEIFKLDHELLANRTEALRRVYELHNLAESHIRQIAFLILAPQSAIVTAPREVPQASNISLPTESSNDKANDHVTVMRDEEMESLCEIEWDNEICVDQFWMNDGSADELI
jgi:hypothetical protein